MGDWTAHLTVRKEKEEEEGRGAPHLQVSPTSQEHQVGETEVLTRDLWGTVKVQSMGQTSQN